MDQDAIFWAFNFFVHFKFLPIGQFFQGLAHRHLVAVSFEYMELEDKVVNWQVILASMIL